MRKGLVYVCVLGMILFSCQSEDQLMTNGELIKGENQEILMKNPCEVKVISDEIFSKENTAVTTRSFASSVPVYRYYGGGDHYYGRDYLGSSCNINGYSYRYEVADFKVESESVSNSLTTPLYRHYNAEKNDHRFSTNGFISGYTREALIGYIFKTPQLGTVPLMEYYSPGDVDYFYLVRNDDINYLDVNNIYAEYKGALGYVYLGQEWVDYRKQANKIGLSKLQAVSCQVNLIVNAYEGSRTRRTVFNVYLPSYTNGWHGAYAEVILDPTWSVSSIEMTVETFDNSNNRYTNTFNVTSTSISPEGIVKGDMTLYLSTNTTSKGAETTINLNYLNVTSEF